MTDSTAPELKVDPGANEHPRSDQVGIGPDGKPVADNLTGTGSDAAVKEHDPDNPHKMTLARSSPIWCTPSAEINEPARVRDNQHLAPKHASP